MILHLATALSVHASFEYHLVSDRLGRTFQYIKSLEMKCDTVITGCKSLIMTMKECSCDKVQTHTVTFNPPVLRSITVAR